MSRFWGRYSIQILDDGSGTNPVVEVSAAGCGEGAFSGVLLLGGDAALDEIASPFKGASAPTPVTYTGELMNDSLRVGFLDEVQGFTIVKQSLPACTSAGLSTLREITFIVVGRFQSPIADSTTILGVSAPRTAYALPRMGAFDAPVPSSMLGNFTLPGESRDLVRPLDLTLMVDGPALRAEEVIESSEPLIEDSDTLRWVGTNSMAATARVLDRDAQVSLLQANAYLAIAFGIAASIVSTFLLDLVRTPPAPPASGTGPAAFEAASAGAGARQAAAPVVPAASTWWSVLAAGLVLSAFALMRRARR
jgi:hypothetical protein